MSFHPNQVFYARMVNQNSSYHYDMDSIDYKNQSNTYMNNLEFETKIMDELNEQKKLNETNDNAMDQSMDYQSIIQKQIDNEFDELEKELKLRIQNVEQTIEKKLNEPPEFIANGSLNIFYYTLDAYQTQLDYLQKLKQQFASTQSIGYQLNNAVNNTFQAIQNINPFQAKKKIQIKNSNDPTIQGNLYKIDAMTNSLNSNPKHRLDLNKNIKMVNQIHRTNNQVQKERLDKMNTQMEKDILLKQHLLNKIQRQIILMKALNEQPDVPFETIDPIATKTYTDKLKKNLDIERTELLKRNKDLMDLINEYRETTYDATDRLQEVPGLKNYIDVSHQVTSKVKEFTNETTMNSNIDKETLQLILDEVKRMNSIIFLQKKQLIDLKKQTTFDSNPTSYGSQPAFDRMHSYTIPKNEKQSNRIGQSLF